MGEQCQPHDEIIYQTLLTLYNIFSELREQLYCSVMRGTQYKDLQIQSRRVQPHIALNHGQPSPKTIISLTLT